MNNFKRLPALLAILVVAGMIQVFTSCSSNDDGGGTPSSSSVGDNPPLSSSEEEQELSSSNGDDVPDLSSSSDGDVVPSSSSEEAQGGESSITDSRDSKKYRIVQIGEQVWFAENLNYNVSGSKCYDNFDSNCEIYGRLYDWETAKTVCPSGWHLPTKEEWDVMMAYIGVPSGWKLKATSGWKEYQGKVGGTDDYGFSALPGGLLQGGNFVNVNIFSYFWSASENNSENANAMQMSWTNDDASGKALIKSYLLSVRCLQGEPSSSSVDVSSSSITDDKEYKTVKIGEQVWMAENLNYKTSDGRSRCYPITGDTNSNDNDNDNCDKYGRLYTWATAMALPLSCNSNSCSSQIQPNHRGICPSGWHIPSNEDWDILYRYADSTSGTSSPYSSSTAGKYLKAVSGWNSYIGIENLDSYGFSALPGGYGGTANSFYNVGYRGYWWSASEYIPVPGYAYHRYMYYFSEDAGWDWESKPYLLSVRCLQD
jgi:uncharacterized protein (TIGR02145 family)